MAVRHSIRNAPKVAAKPKTSAETPIEWCPDRVYSRSETIAFWKISPNTLAKWQREGLPVLARGMQNYRYYGQDVIDFVRLVAPSESRVKGAIQRNRKTRLAGGAE